MKQLGKMTQAPVEAANVGESEPLLPFDHRAGGALWVEPCWTRGLGPRVEQWQKGA